MKTVYLLGAGASIGNTHGKFPGIDTIFRTAKDLNILSETTKKVLPQFDDLSKYVKTIMKKNVLVKSEKINIETLMTYIDLELEASNDNSYYYGLKAKLNKIIRDVIINSSEAYWSDNEYCEYKLLSDTLSKEDTIVTYNWDTMLDDILGRKFLINDIFNHYSYEKEKFRDNQYYNFLYDISAIALMTRGHISIDLPYKDYVNKKGYFLKQHGSIDWYYCSNKDCRAYGEIFPMDEHNIDGYYCSECHTKLEVLIVPPILNKRIRTFPALNRIWNLSAQEISNCQRLVIWGYSFPPTDFYSKWLISKNSNSIEDLIIINPNLIRNTQRNIFRNSIFFNNIKSVLPIVNINTSYYEYFKDFISHNDINNKYGKVIF
jgi:hypothetical protein